MRIRKLWFVLLIIHSGCTSVGGIPPAADSGITFLHMNDTYRVGAVEDGTRGGFGRVVTIIRELQREGREVRLLHGGDFLYPSLESQIWNGEQMIEAFNFMDALAPMIVVPGNHEFDGRSPDTVRTAIETSTFTWVGGNLELDTGNIVVDQALKPYHVLSIGGRQIGVLGLTLVPSDGGNERDYIEYGDGYLASARESLAALEAANADLIVGLTHLHMQDDLRIARLKRDYEDFMFIVGGHEHEPEHQPATATTAEVMKGASNARAIWRIDVDFDAADSPRLTTRLIELDAGIAEDSEYQDRVASKWRERLLEKIPFLPSRIGDAAVSFDAREVTIRNEESNWGNFVADQMRTAFGDEPPADLAFINSGTLRIDDYIAGDITFEDIARTFGFSSFLQYLTMSGAEFRQTLEAGYRGEGPSKGYFPQVSGFRVCIDRSRPEGRRIAQMQVPENGAWSEIEPDRDYLVVAPEYLIGGGDGYEFPDTVEPSRPGSELKYLVLDAVIRASAAGGAVGEPVDAASPRIAFAESPGALCFR